MPVVSMAVADMHLDGVVAVQNVVLVGGGVAVVVAAVAVAAVSVVGSGHGSHQTDQSGQEDDELKQGTESGME